MALMQYCVDRQQRICHRRNSILIDSAEVSGAWTCVSEVLMYLPVIIYLMYKRSKKHKVSTENVSSTNRFR